MLIVLALGSTKPAHFQDSLSLSLSPLNERENKRKGIWMIDYLIKQKESDTMMDFKIQNCGQSAPNEFVAFPWVDRFNRSIHRPIPHFTLFCLKGKPISRALHREVHKATGAT